MIERLQTLLPHLTDEIVLDFEYISQPGELQVPVCMVAKELRSGAVYREFFPPPGGAYQPCPFPTDRSRLFIAYAAAAEAASFLQLNWKLPALLLDLYVEWIQMSNDDRTRDELKRKGKDSSAGLSLLGACTLNGIGVMARSEKAAMRERIIAGYPFGPQEQEEVLAYCEEDVDATIALLKVLEPSIKNPQAALRNARYMKSVARMQDVGIPVDAPLAETIRQEWPSCERDLLAEVNKAYGVYENGSLRMARLEAYAEAQGIEGWPRTPNGHLSTDKGILSDLAEVYPQLKTFTAFRATQNQMRTGRNFPIGRDGRCRAWLNPFGSVTARNQPSSNEFLFGPAAWLRHLARPRPGRVLTYIDWRSQEFAIAGALSGDVAMQEIARSADPYIRFAQLAGSAPEGATKESHPEVRRKFKAMTLGLLYGKTPFGLAKGLKISIEAAEELLDKQQRLFSTFWRWLDLVISNALFTGVMTTKLGWERQIPPGVKPNRKDVIRSLSNWPMQACAAEMMRSAAIYSTEGGIQVCAPIHDAFLIESSEADIECDTERMIAYMNRASRELLGAAIPVEVKPVIRYPNRFIPNDKQEALRMWEVITKWLENREQSDKEFELTS